MLFLVIKYITVESLLYLFLFLVTENTYNFYIKIICSTSFLARLWIQLVNLNVTFLVRLFVKKPFYKACLAQISRTIAFSSLMDCNKTAVSLG
jgi:hypothetical protein